MPISYRSRELLWSLALTILLLALTCAVIALASQTTSIRLLAALVGALVVGLAAHFSGNPRLLCLCGLGFSIPFLFAKTIGPALNKGGGEVAFNVDVTDVFLIVLAGFLLSDYAQGRRRFFRVPTVSYAWMAIIFMGLVTIVFGTYRITAAHEVFRMLKMLGLFLILCQELESPKRLGHWSAALISGLLVNAVVGLAQSYFRVTFGLADLGEAADDVTKTLAATSVKGVEIWRAGAFLVHPNVFGAFLAALLPLALTGFLLPAGFIRRTYYLLSSVLGAGALIASGSRSGWLSFAFAFICLMAAIGSHRRMRKQAVIAAVAVGVALLAIGIGASGMIAQRLFESKEEALSFRGVFNEEAKSMIAEKPLWGFGLNSYVFEQAAFAKYKYGSWPPPVHHIYYLWWAETGLVGLCLHLTIWGAMIWRGIRNLRVRNEQMFAINAACLVGLLAFILDGFVSFSLRVTPTLKTFWVLSAMIMAVHYWRLRHEVHQAPVPPEMVPDLLSSPGAGLARSVPS